MPIQQLIHVVFIFYLILTLTQPAAAVGQLSAEDVYNLDVVVKEEDGSSERAVAKYFINMGLMEQHRLTSEEKRNRDGLDDDSKLRKQLLDEVLLPVNEMMKSGNVTSDTWNALLLDGQTYLLNRLAQQSRQHAKLPSS